MRPNRPLATQQTRLVLALIATAKLLGRAGERGIASNLHPLAEALQDHVDGKFNPLLGIEKPTRTAGRRPDSSALWRLRSNLIVGLEFTIAGGAEVEAAISKIAKLHHRKLQKLHRPGTDLVKSIRTWLKSFANDEVSNDTALAIYKEDMEILRLAKDKYSQSDLRKAGEKLIVAAAEHSAHLP